MSPSDPLELPSPAPTPPAPEDEGKDEEVSITDIDLDDSAEINQENLQALLARAKQAAATTAKKSRMAFDTTRALADSGKLKLPPKTEKFTRAIKHAQRNPPKSDKFKRRCNQNGSASEQGSDSSS